MKPSRLLAFIAAAMLVGCAATPPDFAQTNNTFDKNICDIAACR